MTAPIGIKATLVNTGWLPAWLHARWEAEATEQLMTSVFGLRRTPNDDLVAKLRADLEQSMREFVRQEITNNARPGGPLNDFTP